MPYFTKERRKTEEKPTIALSTSRESDLKSRKVDLALLGNPPASPVPLAYWTDDEARNTGAANLIANKQIGIPDFNLESGTYTFACYSSLTVERDSNPTVYSITFSPADGVACTCQDFGHRGGACKHIRAALVLTEILRKRGTNLPFLRSWIPDSAEDAYLVQARRHASSILASSHTPTPLNPITRAALAIDEIVQDSDSLESNIDSPSQTSRSDILFGDSDSEHTSDAESVLTNSVPDGDTDDRPLIVSGKPTYSTFDELERVADQQALNEQTIARTLQDLELAAPKLSQISAWLSEAHLAKDAINDARRARDIRYTLNGVIEQLDRMLREFGGVDKENSPNLHPLALPSSAPGVSRRSGSHKAYSIIGPPVERRAQKRKESYGIH
ncbi:hypothetical protein BC629DRAFT_1737852 [Irpex lacteus]|nr:hypothetical protein BC629DRAFT_1737852 [Irpex lacteus]